MTYSTDTNLNHIGIVGVQHGDEGKGKIVDTLSERYDIVVRFGGGANSGHTVVVEGQEPFVYHAIPCGVLSGKKNMIGNGCATNLDRLHDEAEALAQRGSPVTPENLVISSRTHLTTPYHLLLDLAEEVHKGRFGGRVGTTMQGIGPTIETKAYRSAFIRAAELRNDTPSELEHRLAFIGDEVKRRLKGMDITVEHVLAAMDKSGESKTMTRKFRDDYFDGENFVDDKKVLERMLQHKERYTPFFGDVSLLLTEANAQGKRIMFEGAQGTLLDPNQGTYPKTTGTTTTMAGIHEGTGTYFYIARRLGVMKAYATRVGEGGFPTELVENGSLTEVGAYIQDTGKEFGATTKRPRRPGWLDLFAAKHACRVNGFNEMGVMKIDVLDKLKALKVCVGYKLGGEELKSFPDDERDLARVEPIYETLPGWNADTSKASDFEELPKKARDYALFIEKELKVPVRYISNGEKRCQLITRHG